jgi:hypothetical protein
MPVTLPCDDQPTLLYLNSAAPLKKYNSNYIQGQRIIVLSTISFSYGEYHMRKKIKPLVIFVSAVVLAAAIWLFFVFYEGEKPQIRLTQNIDIIGSQSTLGVTFVDMKSGLKQIVITISQDNEKQIIHTAEFAEKGNTEETVVMPIDYRTLRLRDGKAIIHLSATDFSLRENRMDLAVDVIIDTTPPRIALLTSSNYITPGGSCVVAFTLSEEVKKAGVSINDVFFTAYPIHRQSENSPYVCYLAVPLDAQQHTMKMVITSEDKAGNVSLRAIPFHLRNKTFRHDSLRISDAFLNNKIPEFSNELGTMKDASPQEIFIYINEKVRSDNIKKVVTLCQETSDTPLWEGPFLRLRNAATMAHFGDKRSYYFQGKIISRSTHMGVDLASVKNAPIEASNGGVVAFTGYIGIFGNTVIIDHGLGLFSFYAHLSAVTVNKGQHVNKGDIIGDTGLSGLAGGDHLHFGMFVGHSFVDPKEWWDPHWIKDNIDTKLDGIAS